MLDVEELRQMHQNLSLTAGTSKRLIIRMRV